MFKKFIKFIKKRYFSKYVFIIPGRYNNLKFKDMLRFPFLINVDNFTPLCQIMFERGTDKALYSGNSRHNYTPVYHAIMKNKRRSNIKLFEVGIGTINEKITSNMGPNGIPGASLRGWKDYFKYGKIYGADIDDSILFHEDRIHTYHCDQTNTNSIRYMWENISIKESVFDFIIDDGLHTFLANKSFLENSIHKLSTNGVYIIEDVVNSEIKNWRNYLSNSRIINFRIKYWILKVPNIYNSHDNNLLMIVLS